MEDTRCVLALRDKSKREFFAGLDGAVFKNSSELLGVPTLGELMNGSYELCDGKAKELSGTAGLVLLTSVSAESFLGSKSKTRAVQTSSLAKARLVVSTGVVLKAVLQPTKALYTAEQTS